MTVVVGGDSNRAVAALRLHVQLERDGKSLHEGVKVGLPKYIPISSVKSSPLKS